MNTQYYTFAPGTVRACADILLGGGLVAFPTETVYGLGADARNDAAARRIYAVKGRPSDNPMIVHVADRAGVERVAAHVPPLAEKLIAALTPGPLTLVLQKDKDISEIVTGGLRTVAVRIPSHPVALALLSAAAIPICAPSANLSTRPSPTSSAHVLFDLAGSIDAVIEGGECRVGVESTVLDLTGERPVILREGGTPREAILAVTGTLAERENGLEHPKSPGMKYRHYAPDAKVYLFEHGDGDGIKSRYASLTAGGQRGLIISSISDFSGLPAVYMPDVNVYANRLFAILRDADKSGFSFILAEMPVRGGLGEAVRNRLVKAAGDKEGV